MDELVFSVTELNTYVQRSLQSDPILRRIRVRGEVSNFKRYSSGHCYFSLRDDRSRISCAWFANSQDPRGLSVLRDGAKVQVIGSAGLYPRDGQFQLIVEQVRAEGVGMWQELLRQSIERLRSEGLLDPARKRPLPQMPGCVGVITSPSGAAIRDIIRVATRRMPWVRILLYPVAVQGEDAPDQLLKALAYFSEHPVCDVVIIGRGGGSVEDLWAFNDERVARAVAACPVPVISAVGHEINLSLTDLVADEQAATPSMAAERAVPDASALRTVLMNTRRALDVSADQAVSRMEEQLKRRRHVLSLLTPDARYVQEIARISASRARLDLSVTSRMRTEEQKLVHTKEVLRAFSPARVLERGYAMAILPDGRPLVSAEDVDVGDPLRLYYAGGNLKVQVTDKSEERYGKD